MSKNQQLKGRSLFFNNIKNESSFNSPIDGIYDTPEVEDPSIAGFLFGLTCILLALVFGALFIPFILAIVGVVTSMIGLIQDAGDQYVTGIILAMFGLAMCGFVLIYLYPIIGPVAAGLFAFFIANPGVFISLLLLLGLYLLMNGF